MDSFTRNYKLYAKKIPGESEDDYNIDHTSYMYIFDKDGQFINILGSNLDADELAEGIEDAMTS